MTWSSQQDQIALSRPILAIRLVIQMLNLLVRLRSKEALFCMGIGSKLASKAMNGLWNFSSSCWLLNLLLCKMFGLSYMRSKAAFFCIGMGSKLMSKALKGLWNLFSVCWPPNKLLCWEPYLASEPLYTLSCSRVSGVYSLLSDIV
jgi:hypothetical protein